MNTLNTIMTFALAMLTSHTVLANPPINDRSFGPPSIPLDSRCSLSAGGAVVDYGTLSRGQLRDATSGANALSLGKRTITVSVVCPYSQSMRLTLLGEAAPNGKLHYGIRGHLRITLQEAHLDGQPVMVANSTTDGILNASPTPTLELQPGKTMTPVIGGVLAKGRNLTLNLELEPVLPNEETRVSSRQTSESQWTLELSK